MSELPLVSILMNCYNGEKYLRESLESVLNQSYENWELIFWDNQSNDESAKIFLSYSDKRLRYYLAPEHTSLGNARILASKKIRGDWLGIIDVDDIWEKNKLSLQIEALNHCNFNTDTVGLIYCKSIGIDKYSNITNEISHRDYKNKTMPQGQIFEELLFKGNFIISPTILLNANAFFSVGGFPQNTIHASDYYISCAISSQFNALFVDEFLTRYRVHDNNNTNREKVLSYKEQLKIFNYWKKKKNFSLIRETRRIKEINTFIGLMMIKYDKQVILGLCKICKDGLIFYAIKNVFLNFINLLKVKF